MTDISAVVASFPLFEGATSTQLAELLEEARIETHPEGACIFDQDVEADAFFILLKGRLRISKVTPDGQCVVMRFASPGDLVGVAVVFGRTTYPATATAVTDSIALAWPTSAWPNLIARYPSLASAALQTVGTRLLDAHTRVVELSTEQVGQRIAHALIRLGKMAGRRIDQGIQVDFPISRQDIAAMTGTTLHNVSRILSAWEAQGLVRGGRRRIVICAPHRLLLLAEGNSD